VRPVTSARSEDRGAGSTKSNQAPVRRVAAFFNVQRVFRCCKVWGKERSRLILKTVHTSLCAVIMFARHLCHFPPCSICFFLTLHHKRGRERFQSYEKNHARTRYPGSPVCRSYRAKRVPRECRSNVLQSQPTRSPPTPMYHIKSITTLSRACTLSHNPIRPFTSSARSSAESCQPAPPQQRFHRQWPRQQAPPWRPCRR
jgi:hypothetical protein